MRAKKFLIVSILLLFSGQVTVADDFDGLGGSTFDYRFLDDPFAGQKMVSDKEFNEVLQQRQKKANSGFFAKLFKKDAKTPPPEFDYGAPSEISSLKDAVNRKPTILLGPQIIDADGTILPAGYYQIAIKAPYMELSQGSAVVGKLKIQKTKDDWNTNNIIYARVLEVNDDVIKIIYSNLDDTFEGFARIKR